MTITTTVRMRARTGWTIGKTWPATGPNAKARGKRSARSGMARGKRSAHSARTAAREIEQNAHRLDNRVRARPIGRGREQALRLVSRARHGTRQESVPVNRTMNRGDTAVARPPDPWIEAARARVRFRVIRVGDRRARPVHADKAAGAPVAAAGEAVVAEDAGEDAGADDRAVDDRK